MDKINRLQELGELLKSNTITKEEFDKLKKEILSPKKNTKKNPKLIELEDLLHSNAITEEEFDGLKKEVLSSNQNNSIDKDEKTFEERTLKLKKLYKLNRITLKQLEELYHSKGILFDEYVIRKNTLSQPSKTINKQNIKLKTGKKEKIKGIHKPLSENEKKILGKNKPQTILSKSKFSNYSPTQIILALAHLLTPLVIAIILSNTEFKEEPFYLILAWVCFVTFGIVSAIIFGGTKDVATGRSFRTKSGIKINEYIEEQQPDIILPDLHYTILFIHLGYPILLVVFWIIGTFNN